MSFYEARKVILKAKLMEILNVKVGEELTEVTP
jgi:hypothetical protein